MINNELLSQHFTNVNWSYLMSSHDANLQKYTLTVSCWYDSTVNSLCHYGNINNNNNIVN